MAICKAENIGLRGYADCLVEPHPYTCEYAVPFGSGILCRHPQRDVIIENTLNAPNGDANANEWSIGRVYLPTTYRALMMLKCSVGCNLIAWVRATQR